MNKVLTNGIMKGLLRDYIFPSLLVMVLFLTMLLYRPAEIPPLWFDEGWPLTIARNWVETGQYARFLMGNPVSGGSMVKPFSVTGPIALSFSLFGIGIWQGRLPSMICIALSMLLIFHLARKLFDPRVAFLTLFVLLFMAGPIHPLIIGRQAMGEAPMLFYLLGGYIFLLDYLNGKKIAFLGVIIFWGLALDSKGHVLPFWSVAMIFPLIVTFLYKQWHYFKLLSLAWVGSFPVYFLMGLIQKVLTNHLPLYEGIHDYFTLRTFVITPDVRFSSVMSIFLFGIPTLVGLYDSINRTWHEFKAPATNQPAYFVRLSLLSLIVSWFSWYALLSLGWARYFIPISFIGSIFLAYWMDKFLSKCKPLFLGTYKKVVLSRIKIYMGVLFLVLVVSLNFAYLRIHVITGDNYATRVAEYVKQTIDSDAVIETYESELMFLLNNPYHFPPDQVEIELNRRYYLGQDINITYDPTPVNFRYLIVGPISTMWQLYTPLLQKDQFQMIYELGPYSIYKRLR